jgi:hypothetical protein
MSQMRFRALTFVDLLLDGLGFAASRGRSSSLGLELGALVVSAAGVQRPLERIALPTEDVVTVLAKSRPENNSLVARFACWMRYRETHASPME